MSDISMLRLDGGMDWVNANERGHWAKRAPRTRYWRNRAYVEARRAKVPPMDRAHIAVTFHKTTNRPYDPANLYPTAKAIVDGLVDAGVLPDDDKEHLVGPDMRAGGVIGNRQIVVTITPLTTEETR